MLKENWGNYLENKFEEYSDKVAVIDIGKNVRCTYRELKRRTEEIEKAYIGQGIERGTHVVLLFPSSSKWISNFLALIHIGAVPVCLNCENTVEELAQKIKHSDSKMIITNESVYAKIRGVEEEFGVDLIVIENRQCACSPGIHCSWGDFIEKGKQIDEEKVLEARAKVKYDDPLAIQYTSGTTGTPKAVISLHYRVLNNMKEFSEVFQYTNEDIIFSSLPMYHVMGCFFSCLLTFMVGGTLVLMGKFNTERVIEALIEEKCTSFHGVPAMYRLVLRKLNGRSLGCLNKGMIGGSCCDEETMNGIINEMHIKNIMPNYGQSEACGYTQTRLGDPIEKVTSTVGRPIPGVEIKIINEEGEELPSHTRGEIIVHSDYRMAGYYKDEEATKKVIMDGWIHTGDLGELDEEGYLKITGRKKDIIIRGGENISPVGIENVLKKNKYIREVVVVGIPDKVMGQEIGAFITLNDEYVKTNNEMLVEEIKQYAAKHLAKYEIPKYIKIMKEFPLTGSGKVQRFKLTQLI